MIFQAGAAMALELIALAAGFWILLKSRRDGAGMKTLGTAIGYFIVAGAFLAFFSTSYYTVRYVEEGKFSNPNSKQAMVCKMNIDPHAMMGGKMDMGTRRGDKECSMDQTKNHSGHPTLKKDKN